MKIIKWLSLTMKVSLLAGPMLLSIDMLNWWLLRGSSRDMRPSTAFFCVSAGVDDPMLSNPEVRPPVDTYIYSVLNMTFFSAQYVQ